MTTSPNGTSPQQRLPVLTHERHRARTGAGKLHLCALKDLHSNKSDGYSIDSRLKAPLAVAALRNGLTASMGRVGACGDNDGLAD